MMLTVSSDNETYNRIIKYLSNNHDLENKVHNFGLNKNGDFYPIDAEFDINYDDNIINFKFSADNNSKPNLGQMINNTQSYIIVLYSDNINTIKSFIKKTNTFVNNKLKIYHIQSSTPANLISQMIPTSSISNSSYKIIEI